ILNVTGANSGTGLRSMPVKILLLDEVDKYPHDVDEEGDPIALAEERTSNFARKKILLTSSPTVKGLSTIEREFVATDQRRYFLPCPECGAMDWIRWENIRWEADRSDSARLACVACGALVEERWKTWMMDEANGAEWRPTAECADPLVRG